MEQAVIGSRVQEMFGTIASRYDLTNTVLSFGVHFFWRTRMMKLVPVLPDGAALDLCTGTGDLLPPLAKKVGTVIGADFCAPMLWHGLDRKRKCEQRIELVQADGLQLPFPDASFDVVTVSFGVRNFENLQKGLYEIVRVLRPQGRVLILEFGQPRAGIFAALYSFYSSHVMPLIGGLLTGNRDAYTYLPQTAKAFPCAEAFTAVLRGVGLTNEQCLPMTGGISYLYQGTKP